MSPTKREPSCTKNHDVQRMELRDKGLPPRECPSCGWLLKAAQEQAEHEDPIADMQREIEDIKVHMQELEAIVLKKG